MAYEWKSQPKLYVNLLNLRLCTWHRRRKVRLYSSIEFHFPIFATFFPELLFQRLRRNCLSLGESGQSERESKDGSCEDQACFCISHRVLIGRQCRIPRFTGSVIFGLRFSHSVCCNRTKIKGGSTMMGVELSTLLRAVSPTASVAAFLLLPRLRTCEPSFSFCAFSSSLKVGKTSIPWRISSPRIRNTLRAPAEATAAKGTSRVKVVFAVGDRRLRRGTIALRPRATEQEAETAKKYDFAIVDVERGVDLLALALLMPTLRDWLVICQRSVPVVCDRSARFWGWTEGSCTWRPGVSIPAVTIRLEMTKQDMRKGRKTGCPVSKLSAVEDGCATVASYQGAA